MENIKEQLEEVIKKNLPDKKDVNWNDISSPELIAKQSEAYGFNQALSQIDTSLIADEVLKVVVENITKFAIYNYHNGERYIEFKEENLLSNLSTNKENEK